MGDFLRTEGQVLAAAVFVAIGLELVRRLLVALAKPKSAVPGEESGRSLYALLSLSLVPVIGVLAFVPARAVIRSAAFLMDLGAHVDVAALPNGRLIEWTLVVLFLVVQLWHVMGLKDFWSRIRYLFLLVSVPLVPQMLAWLAFDLAVRVGLASVGSVLAANQMAFLLCVGVLPYVMPLVHMRLLVPLLTWAGGLAGEPRRQTLEGIGSAVLVVVTIGLLVLFVLASRTIPFVTQARTLVETRPVAIGAPHICLSDYPAESVRLGEEGATLVAFTITREGGVKNVTILQSSGHERLDLAAVLCVTRWSYVPGMAGGQRVEAPWKAQIKWVLR